jgi:Ca2+-binding RTX toxin-like protein
MAQNKAVLFVDSSISDLESVLRNIGTGTTVITLDKQSDGVLQIAQALASYSDLSAIHILSHGGPGALYLGATVLDEYNLGSYQEALAAIGKSLSDTGDLLLYGCDVAAGSAGTTFIELLAGATGADVAASSDATGAAVLGGDWILEAGIGRIEASTISAPGFAGVLGTITGTSGDDTLTGTAEQDIINGMEGNDIIDGGTNHDSLYGGAGNDTLEGGFGNDNLYGGTGNDTLRDDQGSNYLDGGDGSDSLLTQSLTGEHTLLGGSGADSLNATGKKVDLYGGTEDDNLSANGNLWSNGSATYVQQGDATLAGGDGTDYLSANYQSSALLKGDDGDDSLNVGYVKNAVLEGGSGNDTLNTDFSGYGLADIGETNGTAHRLDGGAGNDTLVATGTAYLHYGKVTLALDGGDGQDKLTVSDSSYSNGAIVRAELNGGAGDDTLTASGVLDLQLTGGAGRDAFVLTAQQYKTSLKGSLQFATQQATQANGWNSQYETFTAKSTEITDFSAGTDGDVLDIKDLLQNAATGYDGTNPFAAGYLKLEQSGLDTLVRFDADGSAGTAKEFVIVAVLKNVSKDSLITANFNPAHSPDGVGVAGQILAGTAEADVLLGGYGDDTITGGAGNDRLDGQAGADVIDGGTGNDTLDGGFGNDKLYGGAGNDTLRDDQGSNYLDGGGGSDSLTTQSLTGEHTLSGGYGADSLNATGKKVVLNGDDDDDNLSANGNLWSNGSATYVQQGDATLAGGDGTDYLSANYQSSALLKGDDGDDSLNVGYVKNAVLEGGSGNDTLNTDFSGYGLADIGETNGTAHRLDGGAGNDTLVATGTAYLHYGKVTLALDGGDGQDKLTVSDSSYSNGAIVRAELNGGAGDDTLTASGVLDLQLTGGAGRDAFVLTAQQYKTSLKGSLQFATQQATQANGWNSQYETFTAKSTEITDFSAGTGGDVLDIKDLLQNAATGYDGTNPFAAGYLKLEQSGLDTLVRFDADGSAGAANEFVTVAVLKNVNASALAAANFFPAFGTPNNDFLEGTPGADILFGIGGNDTLSGGAGTDMLDGGSGDDNLDGGTGVDNLFGGEGADVLAGGEGNDNVNGGVGNDQFISGTGNDRYNGGEGLDMALFGDDASVIDLAAGTASGSTEGVDTLTSIEVVDAGAGNDTVTGSDAADTMFGGLGNDALTGGLGNDSLNGGAGDDNLYAGTGDDIVSAGDGNDLIVGGDGAGNDKYDGGTGIDTVKYTSARAGISVNLTSGTATSLSSATPDSAGIGSDTLSGIENVIGGNYADAIVGSSAANVLEGGNGNDSLNGGTGADTLIGGAGDDLYYVDQALDRVTESGSGGTDTVYSSYLGTYTLGTNVEHGRVNTSGAANLTGNTLANTLYAGAGNNVLKGEGGTDTVSYAYATAAVTASLALTSAQATGGSGTDTLAGIESLTGSNYNDTLAGDGGTNVLNGGAGADRMDGGAGNDTYYVDNLGDLVTERASGGTDLVQSTLSAYTLGAEVENGMIVTTATASLTGNGLANTLYAGAGNNILNGGAGTDTVSYSQAAAAINVSLALATAQATGGSGSDTLVGIENLTGSNFNDTLTGNSGANTLNGGAGADRMAAGDGSDNYYVDNAGDVVTETSSTATGGSDTVHSALASYTLGANIENGRILSTGTANLTGNELDNVLYVGAGNNVFNGGLGTDTVSYTYAASAVTVSLASTAAQATGGSGTDTLVNVESLTGSNYNDKLTGNSGANTLNGGSGADNMAAGDGSDNYYVDNAGDIVTETNSTATGGSDTVHSYLASYTLGANIENGRILSTGTANLTGNELDNVLYVGAGNNVFNGGLGTDTVSYMYAASAVTVSLASTAAQATGGSGTDTLVGIERLIGSNYNDTLSGGSGNNTLTGGGGKDTLAGMGGNDIFDFNSVTESGLNSASWDLIKDFSTGDKIDLSTIDARTSTLTNDAFAFIGSAAFSNTDASGQLRYVYDSATGTGTLYGSTDADASAEFAIQLLGTKALTSGDFYL